MKTYKYLALLFMLSIPAAALAQSEDNREAQRAQICLSKALQECSSTSGFLSRVDCQIQSYKNCMLS
ncbi:hypothetical protein HNQ68_002123 [Pseudochrobactrum saccharolyticum]|uniref:DUF3551 domain-containing protein n=1 Tax=Pseudochrobactrum saccharolyticum TaxID=354352 RepID=A0A7W8AJL4_9HYPH|nr:hypothetical protein [Pseudochrobactrum saccharolyticum]KAB0538322.1 hypothetical protein F7P81_11470 [Pseudochrobactrum saccharolyticum]MBB5091582.1 hypothetical protein [Pseudochrobactrum saccharolyticum]